MEELFRCAGCDADRPRSAFHEHARAGSDRPVTARCRDCRREDRMARLYPAACKRCGRHRRLDGNAACRTCNGAAGLRWCLGCERLRLRREFSGRWRRCKRCRNNTRRR